MRKHRYLVDDENIGVRYATTLLSSLSLERCLDDSFGAFPAGGSYDLQHSGTYIISLPPFSIPPSFPHICFLYDNTYSASGIIGWRWYMQERSRLHHGRLQPPGLLSGSS